MMWLLDHIPQLLATAALVTYATARNKLTPGGIAAGILVAGIHMLHPWPSFFWLLIVFFALGTGITKVYHPPTQFISKPLLQMLTQRQIGHAKKASLTQSSSGGTGGEGARTGAQVFANSGTACILILMHTYLLSSTPFTSSHLSISSGPYFPALQRLLPIGIVAQYAAVASDTFSSELGILATSTPFLITAPWKSVPRGTNGGVTALGLAYGALGSFLLVLTAALTLYVARPGFAMAPATATLLTLMGFLGSVIDSLLGALVQATVTDKKTGRVIEGAGGIRVQVGSVGKDGEGGSRVRTGRDLLTNNGVNFAMAAITSLLAMVVTHGTDIGLPRQ